MSETTPHGHMHGLVRNYAKNLTITVYGLYCQTYDQGLIHLAASREGACIAICFQRLGCTIKLKNFWNTIVEKNTNKLKDATVVNSVMDLILSGDSQQRRSILEDEAKSAGLVKFVNTSESGPTLWEGGPIGDMTKEIFNAECHCLIGLSTGANLGSGSKDGHAIAIIKTSKARRLFDPNFGEFEVKIDNFELFWEQLWKLGKYDFRSFTITRYEPTNMDFPY